MASDPTVLRWHATIVKDCERTLGRQLTVEEEKFISTRGGFIALEMIHDKVKSLASDPAGLVRYLNSEAKQS